MDGPLKALPHEPGAHGLRAWLGGREVYSEPRAAVALGSYARLSSIELQRLDARSPAFELDLERGWNRLSLELSSGLERPGAMRFCLRLFDPHPIEYESSNIAWMTELPARSNAAPFIVGDRIFVMSELDGHFESHFAIVGFTTPTPCSDGSRVWVWCGNGVAACYDLEGRRIWIRRVEGGKLTYSSSPALIGGKFVVHMGRMIALEADTGKTLWVQSEIRRNVGALLPARIAGVGVVIRQQGGVVRTIDGIARPRTPDGSWPDRWMAASPLWWDGPIYAVDIYETLYREDLELEGLFHYNAVRVAASPALIGKYFYVIDNQGTTLVLEPGREFRVVAKNRIGMRLERRVPIPDQETIAYAPIVTDGERLYVRGERFLYAIGKCETLFPRRLPGG